MRPAIPLRFFGESLWVQVPWGKGRAPAFEVRTISHPFYLDVKRAARKIYICLRCVVATGPARHLRG